MSYRAHVHTRAVFTRCKKGATMDPLERFKELSEALPVLVGLGAAIRRAQRLLPKSGDIFMAIDPTLTAAMDSIDKATNDVAAELKDLSAQISTGMTPQDVADVAARLNSQATFLETIAANPNQPVVGTAPTSGDTSGGTGTTGSSGGTTGG